MNKQVDVHFHMDKDQLEYARLKAGHRGLGKWLSELLMQSRQEQRDESMIRQVLSLVTSISREQDAQREILKTLMHEGGK